MRIAYLLDSDLNIGLGILEGLKAELRHFPDSSLITIPQMQEQLFERLIREKQLQGAIGAFISDRWIETLETKIPLINTSTLSDIRSIPSVVADEKKIGRLVRDHFRGMDLSSTACLYDSAIYGARLRRDGFSPSLPGPETVGDTRYPAVLEEWLTNLPERTGIYCTSDFLARRTVQACERLGIKIPERISLVGTGNSSTETILSPIALSSVPLPLTEIGRQALLRLKPQTSVLIPPNELIIRESSALICSEDPVIAKALGIIEQNLSLPPDIGHLSRLTGISRRGLELHFQSALQTSPLAEWRRRQNNRALYLLRNTPLKLEDVAEKCGYSGASHLSAAFKRAGLPTPGACR